MLKAKDRVKCIIPKEPEASIIKYAFAQITEGSRSIGQVYLQVLQRGLRCSRSNFWNLIYNPVYAGYIRIWNSDKKCASIVMGQHIGIVTLQVFEKVQTLTCRKNDSNIARGVFRPEYPFKGVLCCPKCFKTLTASASTSRSKKYHYYHCCSPCDFRIKTTILDAMFYRIISTLYPLEIYTRLFKVIMLDICEKDNEVYLKNMDKALKGIEVFSGRILKAKALLLDSHLDFENYRLTIEDLKAKINILGDTVTFNRNHQGQLRGKVDMALNEFSDISISLLRLDKESKYDFIRNMLVPKWTWNEDEFENIFKQSARKIYGIGAPLYGNDNQETSDAREFLDMLAKIILRGS
jgi:site-specific DNA recombinase